MYKIRILSISFLLLFIKSFCVSQEIISSDNISDLSGAVEIERAGTYKIELTGTKGWKNDFTKTELEKKMKEKNSIFLIKKCSTKDAFSFKIEFKKPTIQLAIFKYAYTHGHQHLNLANMKLVYLSVTPHESYSNLENTINSADVGVPKIQCVKGEAFLIIINNIQNTLGNINLTIGDETKDKKTLIADRTKIIDDRLSNDPTNIVINYFDEETKLPVISNINLLSKKKSAIYVASKLILGSDSKTKIQLKSDAEGYFFKDTTLNLSDIQDSIINIPLQSISIGKSIKINNIEFISGTYNLMPGAENILRRVKDFLILNSEIRIEIQGHVNNDGNESKTTMKLSKKRADVIRKYFINSGINKHRMIAKGYGNKVPIYANPKNSTEQQANRRVEIRIIQ